MRLCHSDDCVASAQWQCRPRKSFRRSNSKSHPTAGAASCDGDHHSSPWFPSFQHAVAEFLAGQRSMVAHTRKRNTRPVWQPCA